MHALTIALEKVFSIKGSLDDIDFAGRTDIWIMRRVFQKFSIPATPENFNRYIEGYTSELPSALVAREVKVLPGVQLLLELIDGNANAHQGLLTGNLRRGAELKLSHKALWHYFPFGGFADDNENRDELGPHALRRAVELHGGSFEPKHIWVIGDTPHDIRCGKVIGACTLAVATGRHGIEELSACAPDVVCADLSDTSGILHRLGIF
jgi:phosphoglycolate phosphatase